MVHLRSTILSVLTLALAAALPVGALAVDPVIEGLPVAGTTPNVEPTIPAGKALMVPVTAYAEGGEQVTFTATSNNPHIMVRVKSGNPLLRFRIKYTGNGPGAATDPDYEGDIVFQLFRDWTPKTVDFIAGFAQGGFYDEYTGHPGLIFHRLADLNAGGAGASSFIYQGGDPAGTGSGGPGFSFDNEFSAPLIFAGRGQLAMANSGYNPTTRGGTNGSQFFITDGQPRHLDFNHTILGQVTHGFEMLAKLQNTPRTGSTPTKSIKIIKAEVIPQYADGTRIYSYAVLVLSANTVGGAQITVTATDANGNKSSRSFMAKATADTRNSPPFVTPMRNRVAPKSTQMNIPFGVVDLEYDFPILNQQLLNNSNGTSQKGFSGLVSPRTLGVIGNPQFRTSLADAGTPYFGPLTGVVSVSQLNSNQRGGLGGASNLNDFSLVTVGVGEKAIQPEPLVVEGAPATALTNAVVARFRDTDGRSTAADFTATINWGDGFAVSDAGGIERDASKPAFAAYQVTGTHTYKRAGQYTAVVTLTSGLGLKQEIRTPVVITDKAISANAGTLVANASRLVNRQLARFSDSSPATGASYTARVDWGDGIVTAGNIRELGNGEFAVFGSHTYRDPEDFSYTVRVHKTGAAPEEDAIAWGRIELSGFTGQQHLPPFDQAHLLALWGGVRVDPNNENSAFKPTKETVGPVPGNSQTFLTYEIQITNSGNKPSKVGKLTLLLSPDEEPDLVPTRDANGNITVPADQPVEYGPPITAGKPQRRTTSPIGALAPGETIRYMFQKGQYGDFRLRLPAGETGTGMHLLGVITYDDPLAKYEAINNSASIGPINGIFSAPRVLKTNEAGSTASFQVRIDKAPLANVTIPLAVADSSEGSIDKTSLVFTPENWFQPQTVIVTGKSDSKTTAGAPSTTARDGNQSYSVLLNAAVSSDSFYSGMNGPDVIVTNVDRDTNLTVASQPLSTSVLQTKEEGTTTAKFTIRVNRAPTDPVSVKMTLSNTAEGEIILPGQTQPVPAGQDIVVTFQPGGDMAKEITVRGKDDAADDGDITYTIGFEVLSEDPQFDGLAPQPVSVKNADNDPTPPTTP